MREPCCVAVLVGAGAEMRAVKGKGCKVCVLNDALATQFGSGGRGN